MLKIYLSKLSFLIVMTGYSQNSNYDSTLAKMLGADEYGMKNM